MMNEEQTKASMEENKIKKLIDEYNAKYSKKVARKIATITIDINPVTLTDLEIEGLSEMP